MLRRRAFMARAPWAKAPQVTNEAQRIRCHNFCAYSESLFMIIDHIGGNEEVIATTGAGLSAHASGFCGTSLPRKTLA